MRRLISSKPLRSLATRINLLVFVATMASSILVSAISLQSLDGFFRGKVEQSFPQVARRISIELDHWFTLRAREIEVFAKSTILVDSWPELRRGGRRGGRARREAKQYLRYVLENFPNFDRLILSDHDGNTLIEVANDSLETIPWSAEWATEGTDTRFSQVHRVRDRDIQIVSTPLVGADGNVGELHAQIDLNAFTSLLESRDLGASARVLLVDGEGRILNSGGETRSRYEAPDISADDDASVVKVHFDDALGMRVVSTRTKFSRFDWDLIVQQPYDEVFAPVVDSMRRAVALNIAIVLACCLGAMRLARSIVRPLRALADAAERLSEGEREVEIDESHSSEEIELLTRAFNEMSRALGSSSRKLEESHHAIESANLKLVLKNDELSRVNLVLEQLSITDGLTKLHNHRYFQDNMRKACKRSVRTKEPLALLLIDIDYFKRWNDRLGHAGGDEILAGIADIFNNLVRETDFLARYGGEEFAVLATDTSIEGAVALAEKLREGVEASGLAPDLPGPVEQLTVSIGVAALRGDSKQLFAEADEALYRAKDEGRNCVVLSAEQSRA